MYLNEIRRSMARWIWRGRPRQMSLCRRGTCVDYVRETPTFHVKRFS